MQTHPNPNRHPTTPISRSKAEFEPTLPQPHHPGNAARINL